MNSLKNCSVSCKAAGGNGNSMLKLSFTLFVFILCSCGADAYEKKYLEEQSMVADSISSHIKGLYSDTINGITHNFIRNANVKMKVMNVMDAANKIEEEIRESGGYTSLSEISSEVDHINTSRLNEDSLFEQTYYNVNGKIKLHVPAKALDSVLSKITELGLFIDHKKLNADDVKMELFSNLLAEKRSQEYKKKTELVPSAKNIKQHLNIQNSVLQKQEQADSKRIESYEITEKVNYSVIDLELYQDKKMSVAILPFAKIIPDYEPSFFKKLGASLENGFTLLKNLILFLANLWSLGLIVFILFLSIRKTINHYSKISLKNSVLNNKPN